MVCTVGSSVILSSSPLAASLPLLLSLPEEAEAERFTICLLYTSGRLTFSGGAEMIAAANLHLRTVERVMLLLARYKASTFDELFDGCPARSR